MIHGNDVTTITIYHFLTNFEKGCEKKKKKIVINYKEEGRSDWAAGPEYDEWIYYDN